MRDPLDPESYRLQKHRFDVLSRLVLMIPPVPLLPIAGKFAWFAFSNRLYFIASVDMIVASMETLSLVVAVWGLFTPKKCDSMLILSASKLYFVAWVLVILNVSYLIYLLATATEFWVPFILGLAVYVVILSPLFLGQWFLVRELFE